MIGDATESEMLRAENERLRRELALYRAVVAQLPTGIYIYQLEDLDDDRSLRMVDANLAVAQLTGVPPEAVIGKTLDENFPGLREQGVPQAYANVVRTGKPYEVESIYGDERIIQSAFSVQAAALPDNCVLVTFDNITQRKRVEEEIRRLNAELQQRFVTQTEALHQSQQHLQAVMSSAPILLFVLDAEGIFTFAEGKGWELAGFDPAQIVDQSVFALYQHNPDWLETVRRVLAGEKQVCLFHLGHTTYENYLIPTYDDQGQPAGVLGVAIDITERRRAEQALEQSETRFRTIVEKIPTGICITNQDYRYEYVNPAYCNLYHYTAEELHGQPFTMVVPEEQRAELRALHDQFLAEQVEIRGEWTVMNREGQRLSILADAAYIVDIDGKPKKVTFVTDITQRKQVEQERAILQQQVIEAQRAALRELSTPLIPISDHVLIMPLIGTIDSQRAQQVMESLLEGVSEHHAETVILDITGVQVVDTQVANAFIQAAQAVKLLGAQVMITGIQPQIAQTLIQLGVDLSMITTRGTLQAGIAAVLNQRP